MIRKIFGGGVTAAVAVAAVLLVLTGAGTTVSANVNSVSAAPTTIDTEQTSVITIDADEGDGDVRILATTGDFIACTEGDNATDCLLDDGAVLEVDGNNDRDISVLDNLGTNDVPIATNVDTLLVTWEAPATGGTANITAIQDNVAKSASITVRGAAATVELSILEFASSSTTACQGDVISVLNGVGANNGNIAAGNDAVDGNLCSIVKDAAGNRLPNMAVIYSTTDGTVAPLTDTTGVTGQVANASTIVAGSTGQPGDTATVTASAGGQSATAEVQFGGNPASCTLTTDPTSVAVGGSTTVNVSVLDSTGGPVPDGTSVGVAQANPGAGVNAQILGSPTTTSDGAAKASAIAAIQGAIALGAQAPNAGGSNPVTCTGTVIATGSVIPPVGGTPGPGGATGGFTGTAPGDDSIGLLVTSGEATSASLTAALGTAGCTVQTLAVLQGGEWLIFINGAPAVVNAQFPATLAATTPFFVRCS
jgi:hypothetical protein